MKAVLRPGQRGGTLVEVMVALLLLSFGVLGMVGLKLTGLSAVAMSAARDVAAHQASQMLDRVRANPARARAGDYNLGIAANTPASATTIAEVDLQEWRRGLAADLPGGGGGVAVDGAGVVTITVRWRELRGDGGTAKTQRFTLKGRL